MKGKVGSSTTLHYIKDQRKKYKSKKLLFCSKCRNYMDKGTWVKPMGSLVSHAYPCPKPKETEDV